MKIGAIYVRKSVQTGRGDSIQNQIDLCKDYAKKRNILIDDLHIYCDQGYSGKDFNRPEFKIMINDLKQGKFNVLICYRLDRISRSLNDFSNLSEILEEHKISFVSIKELFDTSTPIGKSMMYIASVFAQLERETIAERLRDNISKLARTGRWLGGVSPTGFESIATARASKLTPIESELHTVKVLFNRFLELNSLSSLENYCTNDDLKSKNNLPFSKTTLKQILTNPVYCIADHELYDYLDSNGFSISNNKNEFNSVNGVLLYNIDGENIVSLAEHHGVIESKEWIEVQEILSNNRKKPYRQGTSSIGLMSGLIKCGYCGSLMRVKHGRRNANSISYYYVCTLKESDRKKCDISNLNGPNTDMIACKQLQESHTEKSFLHFISKYLNLDIIDFKTNNENHNKISIFDSSEDLNTLYSNLATLKHQLNFNKNSSSCKYIICQMERLEKKISLKLDSQSEYTNTDKNFKILHLDNLCYEQLLVKFDIGLLSFESKQYLINRLLNYVIWDEVKLRLHIK